MSTNGRIWGVHRGFRRELEIPPTFWSVVFGSIIALAGVLIQNDAAAERFDKQLRFDAKQKAKERIHKARIETYAEASEALVGAMGHLGNLPNIELSKEEFLFSEKVQVAAAKVQMVASEAVALKVGALSTSLAEVFIAIIPKVIEIRDIQTRIESSAARQAYAESAVGRLRQSLAAADLKASDPPPHQLALVARDLEMHDSAVRDAAAMKDAVATLTPQCVQARLDLLTETLKATDSLMAQTYDAMVAMRTDLDLDTKDGGLYMKEAFASRDRIMKSMQALKVILVDRETPQAPTPEGRPTPNT